MKLQTKCGERACSSASSTARWALLIVASILPRWRTMPASLEQALDVARRSKRATWWKSKPAKAARNVSRLRRIVSHERPDWKPSRQSFSNSRVSSETGRPHSSSW